MKYEFLKVTDPEIFNCLENEKDVQHLQAK